MPAAFRLRRVRVALLVVAALAGLAATAAAQRGYRRFRERELQISNTPYNGQFTFVRVNYTRRPAASGTGACRHGRTAIRSPSRT